MFAQDRLRAIVTGLVAGFAGGLFGVGGGIVLVPLLTGFFALTQHQAHGTSLAAIGATAIAGLFVYGSHGQVDWASAGVIGLASIAFARIGARGAARVSRDGLTRAFAIFLVAVAIRLFWRAPAEEGVALVTGGWRIPAALVVGAGVGLLSGFLGVGGGILAVPALVLLFAEPQRTAQGTSLAVILVTAPFGAIEHHRHGNVATRLVPWLAVGAGLGAPLASSLAQGLPQATLARGFAVFLLANAVNTWVRTARPANKA